jgi:predicted lactoylglutathione lyase
VAKQEDVQPVLDRLAEYGGRILLDAAAPPHGGGMRGYVADPDDHSWEIAWNPQWPISPEGYVTWS